MTIVNPISTANPVVQAGNVQVTTPEERQVDLRLEQIVRATVVEGGLDRALLEMNHRHYRAQSDIELQTGQKLTLQVLQTHPKLEFRVLRDPLGGRLIQLLPLLTRPYDWTGLVSQLKQQTPQAQLPVEMTQVFNQLQQVLQAGGTASSGIKEQIAKLAVQLQQLAGPSGTAHPQPLSANLPPLPGYPFAPTPSLPPSGQAPPAVASLPATEVIAGLEKLLVQVQELQTQKQGLPADLLGRLEGLLDKVRQLPQATEVAPPALPGLEVIAGQLNQLVQHSALRPEGGQLGFLSQLFGLHHETELLDGKKRAALASLKLSLLDLRRELDGKAEEPLQRLELFQLCKAKLAEEQVQFLPLPLPELEEGYLLAEKQPEPDKDEEGAPPLQLSLSLRLSSLGNLRIDLLYEKQGLHLRLAGEDKEKMRYLQNCKTLLKEMLTTASLQGVSFAADAQSPTRQLLERLLPERSGVLDDRV